MRLNRSEAAKIIDYIRDNIKNDKEMSKIIDFDDEMQGSDLIYGVSNGFLSKMLETITGLSVEIVGEVEVLHQCPCCGYRTLREKYDINEGTGYDICPYCNWEDDGTTDIHMKTSINHGSIAEYREKIEKNKDKYYISKWF